MDSKHELRTRLLARRATLDPEHLAADSAAYARAVRALLPTQPGAVAAYLSTGAEPSTRVLVDELASTAVEVLVPRALATRRMEWLRFAPGAPLARGRYDIDEPLTSPVADASDRIGVVIVPALAVDEAGRRLGRGGGYYDTLLATLGHDVLRIALVHDHEVLDSVPVDDHDQPVHVVVTPSRTLDLR